MSTYRTPAKMHSKSHHLFDVTQPVSTKLHRKTSSSKTPPRKTNIIPSTSYASITTAQPQPQTQSRTLPLNPITKRKAPAPPHNHPSVTKKPKPSPKMYPSDEDFRVTSSWGQVDPIGITNAQIPITSAETIRLRGWYWRVSCAEFGGEECESPMGGRHF